MCGACEKRRLEFQKRQLEAKTETKASIPPVKKLPEWRFNKNISPNKNAERIKNRTEEIKKEQADLKNTFPIRKTT
jgi:hypothetical protein